MLSYDDDDARPWTWSRLLHEKLKGSELMKAQEVTMELGYLDCRQVNDPTT
jgi:hypothetical protein